MSRRFVAAIVTALLALSPFATDAAAQENSGAPIVDRTSEFVSAFSTGIRLDDIDLDQVVPQMPIASRNLASRRSGLSPVLASLYASTAVLQALDAHSTLKGLDRGAMEANPLMSGITQNKFAFIGVKAAVAVGTIYAVREMAKKNKVAAIVTLVAINSVYGYVAHNNYKVASRLGK